MGFNQKVLVALRRISKAANANMKLVKLVTIKAERSPLIKLTHLTFVIIPSFVLLLCLKFIELANFDMAKKEN